MNIFLTIVLIASVIFYTEAGECQVISKPDFVSVVSNNNEQNSGKTTVSNFANNFLTLLGLSTDQNNKKEKAFFYSSRPLEIPATTWLFHVEGVDQLSNNGTSLEDDAEFDINLIYSKLRQTGDSDSLNTVSILITSQSEIDNLQQTLESQISQMDKQATIKYFVIVCDECNNDKAIQQLQNQLKAVIDQIIANDAQTLAIILVTKESARVRRARQADDFSTNGSNITIAKMYSDNYPVMFNLFFWTSLTLGLVLISIVYVFLTLDPGQDTIIYRLTTPRLKAD